jgi:hypothetical protein
MGGLVLVDLSGVNINVDDACTSSKCLQFASHAIVKPHADGEQQVCPVNCIVGEHRPVHAQHLLHHQSHATSQDLISLGGWNRCEFLFFMMLRREKGKVEACQKPQVE